MGPNVGQTLNNYDSITLVFKNKTTKLLKPLKTSDTVIHPLTLYSNYPCQLAHHVYVPNKALTDIAPFVVKLADIQTPVDFNKHVNLNNYTDGLANYTKINVEDFVETGANDPLFTLNINVPTTDNCGLIMFYYIDENYSSTAPTNAAKIVAKDENETAQAIGQYNSNDKNNQCYLKPGIQVIELPPNIKTLSVYPDNERKSTIIFSELKLVKGINPLLDYRYDATTQTDKGLTDLLDKIKAVDSDYNFFYNMPIDNARAIDLNHLVGEKLSSPIA
jgi:hypothetical protein